MIAASSNETEMIGMFSCGEFVTHRCLMPAIAPNIPSTMDSTLQSSYCLEPSRCPNTILDNNPSNISIPPSLHNLPNKLASHTRMPRPHLPRQIPPSTQTRLQKPRSHSPHLDMSAHSFSPIHPIDTAEIAYSP